DIEAVRAFLVSHRACAACGDPAGNAHHILQKGSPHFGDDVPGNLLPICGTGTRLCHGAFHGTPYIHAKVVARRWVKERRDTEWVARRLGQHLAGRPDVLAYLTGKMGTVAAAEYLERFYYLIAPTLDAYTPAR